MLHLLVCLTRGQYDDIVQCRGIGMPATWGMNHRKKGMVKERRKGGYEQRNRCTRVVEIQKEEWFGGIGDDEIRRCRKEGKECSSQNRRVPYQNPNPPTLANCQRTRRLATLSLLAR